MKPFVCLIVFSVVIATVCGSFFWEEEDDNEGDDGLTAQDFYEFFETANEDLTNMLQLAEFEMEKRGGWKGKKKVGRKLSI